MLIDSLASTASSTTGDWVIVDQGGTPGVPNSSVTRKIPAGQFMALAYTAWAASLPNSSAGLLPGDWYLVNGLPRQVPPR
jgi:hypothetical protein